MLNYVPKGKITVSQVFCSAMSFQGIDSARKIDWEQLARIILDATYEATLLAAHQTYLKLVIQKYFLH